LVAREREREGERDKEAPFQHCQMLVTKYYTLVVLALLAAHHIFHISRIKVNEKPEKIFFVYSPSQFL
jgi:hypothetical protein